MNCRQAKTQIALWVGHDLKSADAKRLRLHVGGCPECRDHLQAMKSSLAALHDSEAESHFEVESIWPRVSGTLARRGRRHEQPNRLNRWAPSLAVAALFLAMLSIVNFGHSLEPVDDSQPFNDPRIIPVGIGTPTDFLLPSGRSSDHLRSDEFDAFRGDDWWMLGPVDPEMERRKKPRNPRRDAAVPPTDQGSY